MRACHATQGYKGSAGFGQEAEAGVRGKPKHSVYWGFHRKGKEGRVNSFRLASLNNSSGLWAIGVNSGCLALDALRQGNSGLVCVR